MPRASSEVRPVWRAGLSYKTGSQLSLYIALKELFCAKKVLQIKSWLSITDK